MAFFLLDFLICCLHTHFEVLLTTIIIKASTIVISKQTITHQLSSIRSGERQPITNFIKNEIGSKIVSDTLKASFNDITCTRKSMMVVTAITIVLNHILKGAYADRSKPNRRLTAIKIPPIESIVDFIFVQY